MTSGRWHVRAVPLPAAIPAADERIDELEE